MGVSSSKKADVLEVVVKNADLLECLTDEPLTKHTLANRINVSAKTVYRRTRTLRELGLVEKSDGKYKLTSLGKVHIDMLLDSYKLSRTMCENSELLEAVDYQQLPPYWLMHEARMIPASPHAPEQLTDEINRQLDDAIQVKAISPMVLSYHSDIVFEYIESDSFTAELLFEPSAIEYLIGECDADFGRLSNSGLEVWKYGSTVPFGMLLIESPDPRVIVSFLGPRNRPNGLLITDTVASLNWATELYVKYRSAASRVDNTGNYT